VGLAVAVLAFTLAACGSSSSSSSSRKAAPPITSVTFAGAAVGTLSASGGKFQPAGASRRVMTAITDYSIYKLYCVTFTDPPNAGEGQFDTSGNFSLVVANAAGVPVGCFIVDTSNQNQTVATVTFTIGTASGMDTGTTTGPVFTGGTYTIAIAFDPTTGVATATVTAGGTPTVGGGSSTFSASDLGGSWQMYCDLANALPDLAACGRAFGGLAIPGLFLDPITATDPVKGQVYAMGAWPNVATFIAAGQTEGMAMTLPSGVSAVTSLLADGIGGWSGTAPDPMVKFNGFTSDATAAYSYDNRTTGDVALWTWMKASLIHAELTTNSWVDPGCYSATGAPNTPYLTGGSASVWPTQAWPAAGMASLSQKVCLLAYISVASEKDRNNGLTNGPYYIPRPRGSNWDSYAGTALATNIEFEGAQVAGSPEISARFDLLGLNIAGNAAAATSGSTDSYTRTYWDSNSNTSVSDICTEAHYTNINFVKTAPDIFDGYFSTGQSQICSLSGGSNSSSTFKVKLVRTTATLPFGTAIQLPSLTVFSEKAGSSTTVTPDGSWFSCIGGSPDSADMLSIQGGTLVFAHTEFTTTNSNCGNGELGQLKVAVVGTVALDNPTTQTVNWSNGSAAAQTAPVTQSTAGLLPTSAAKVLASVTASYAATGVTGVPGPGTQHGFLFVLDDSVSQAPALYRETGSPSPACDGTGFYQGCVSTSPMKKRN
jgi:hypothetical protein